MGFWPAFLVSAATIGFSTFPFYIAGRSLGIRTPRLSLLAWSLGLGLSADVLLGQALVVAGIGTPVLLLAVIWAAALSIPAAIRGGAGPSPLRIGLGRTMSDVKEAAAALRSRPELTVVILILAGVALWTRLAGAATNLELPQIDPYGHLAVVGHLDRGDLAPGLGFYDDYPRGWHSLVVLVGRGAGASVYDALRGQGAVQALLPLLAVFLLVRPLAGARWALLGSLFLAGAPLIPSGPDLVARQTLPVPEVLGHTLLLLLLGAVLACIAGPGKREVRHWYPAIILISVAVHQVHPLSALMGAVLVGAAVIPALFSRVGRWHAILALAASALGMAASVLLLGSISPSPHTDLGQAAPGLVAPGLYTRDLPLNLVLMATGITLAWLGWRDRSRPILGLATSLLAIDAVSLSGLLVPAGLAAGRVAPFAALIGIVSLPALAAILVRPRPTGNQGRRGPASGTMRSLIHQRQTRLFVAAGASLTVCALLIFPAPAWVDSFERPEVVACAVEASHAFDSSRLAVFAERVYLVAAPAAILGPQAEARELHELTSLDPANHPTARPLALVFIELKPNPNRWYFHGSITGEEEAKLMIAADVWVAQYRAVGGTVETFCRDEIVVSYLLGTD